MRGQITSADHGRVHVVGSSTVNSYLSVFGSVIDRRSIRCMLVVDPRHSRPGSKLVVSITSVWPSQWPTESPSHLRTVEGRCGRPSVGTIRTSLFDCMIRITYPGVCWIWDSASWLPGSLGGPWFPVTHRSYRPRL